MADQDRRRLLQGLAAMCVATRNVPSTREMLRHVSSGSGDLTAALRTGLLNVLGDMPTRPSGGFKTLESVKLNEGTRYKIEYLSEPAGELFHTPADLIRAYLFVPNHDSGQKLSAVMAIHQDGPQSHIGKSEPAGLAGDKNLFYGLELFKRGHVVLCPDRFYHAERRRVAPNDMSSVDAERDDLLLNHWAGQLLLTGRNTTGKEAYDLMVSTDILTSLEYVDAERIGAIGHSAGGNALVYYMFADPRLRAGVSSCGLFSMLRFFDENAVKKRMAALAMPGLAKVGDSSDYLALIAPRPILLTRGMWEWGNEGEDARHSKEHVQETRDMVAKAGKTYARLGATGNLRTIYFDEEGGNHDFPAQIRAQAYEWLDAQLAPPVNNNK